MKRRKFGSMRVRGFGWLLCLSLFLGTAVVSAQGTSSSTSSAQQPSQRKITGVVTYDTGEPAIAATVVIRNTATGTVTDANGAFELTVPATDLTMEVSYVGYKTGLVPVTTAQNRYTVVLESDSRMIDDVVVVGFGTQRKETVTGAISMVQSKELLQSPQANVSNMLAGRLPGLLAVQRSGEPGADASELRIRGVGTFSTGEGAQSPLVMVDGIETDNYNNIDPNEIESLSILKDASSTAVYGVRGANGVILITTKRGLIGKPQISYSGNISMNGFTDVRETMRSYDYATSFNKARMYDSYITGGYTPRFSDEAVEKFRTGEDPLFYPDVDWYDLMFKDYSFNTQHNISISGGVKNVKYFVSVGYFNQQGMFNNTRMISGFDMQSAYERYNFRSNLDFQVTKRLSVKVNIASQMENRSGAAGAIPEILDQFARVNPTVSPGVVDGKIIVSDSDSNPFLYMYQGGIRTNYRNHLNGSVGLKYDIPGVKGLNLTATVSYENFYSHNHQYRKPTQNIERYRLTRTEDDSIAFLPMFEVAPFAFTQSYGKNRRSYVEAGFNFSRTFADDHNVTALLLYNQSRRVDPNLAYKIPNSYQGIVGRVVYDYRHRYLVEFNVGYNGTENFAEGRRFGLFPAFSLGWVVSEESFWPKNDFVTFLKVRGSYGEVGNDRIGGSRFLYLPTTYEYPGSGYDYNFGEVGSTYTAYPTSREGLIGNPVLTWERAKKTNAGLELSLIKDKIRITADYFIENRDNILTNPNTTPIIFGGTMPTYNMGKMRNSGWDGDITYRDRFGTFGLWARANYTYAHNEVLYMDEVPQPYSYRLRTGQRLNQNFGLICDGIYNTWEEVNDPARPVSSWNNNRIQPGDLIYRDINADGVINDDDQVPIGYSNFPEVMYGFSIGGDWKGFDFSVLFQGASNVSIYYPRLYVRGFSEDFSAPVSLLKSWSQERYDQGLPIEFPHLSEGDTNNQHNYRKSTFWVRDASYIRLKNMELGYTFSGKSLKKARIQSLRIYVNGSNLVTWADMFQGVDPEFADGVANRETYPITKIYNLGVNIKF